MARSLRFCKTLEFSGEEPFNYAVPFQQLADWLAEDGHEEVIVVALNVLVDSGDVVAVIATVEDEADIVSESRTKRTLVSEELGVQAEEV